ncbi:MAG: hypothetical protein ACREQM_20120, partial [Candidatus Dormibacteraceae bacterium]
MKQRFCHLVDDWARLDTGAQRAQWLIDSAPENGTLIATTLDALMRPPAPDDKRSASERRGEALV